MGDGKQGFSWLKLGMAVVGIFVALTIMGLLFDAGKSNGSGPHFEKLMVDGASNPNGSTPEQAAAAADDAPQSNLTMAQQNAVRKANSYLSMAGFSRNGLIEQLSSDAGDGFSVSDATQAVDSLGADWNENAVRSAKQYLSMTGFSCKGLIEQLSSDAGSKYTVSQATYGAKQAGAC